MKTTSGLAVLAWTASTAFAHGGAPMAKKPADDASQVEERAFGREGDPRRVTRTVRLDMTDAFRFTPADIIVKRGETVQCVATNGGRVLHAMVPGPTEELNAHAEPMKKFPDMEHADANMAHGKPGAKGAIVWPFTKAGAYEFACLIPGHCAAGMLGKVVVQ